MESSGRFQGSEAKFRREDEECSPEEGAILLGLETLRKPEGLGKVSKGHQEEEVGEALGADRTTQRLWFTFGFCFG